MSSSVIGWSCPLTFVFSQTFTEFNEIPWFVILLHWFSFQLLFIGLERFAQISCHDIELRKCLLSVRNIQTLLSNERHRSSLVPADFHWCPMSIKLESTMKTQSGWAQKRSCLDPPQSGLQYRDSFVRLCGTAARKQTNTFSCKPPPLPAIAYASRDQNRESRCLVGSQACWFAIRRQCHLWASSVWKDPVNHPVWSPTKTSHLAITPIQSTPPSLSLQGFETPVPRLLVIYQLREGLCGQNRNQ